MKRKLLFAAMFIASALGLEVRAQQWQASAPQDGGTYYLYNVGKGGFLIGNDGRGHVALEPIAGQTITLQADGDNFRIATPALRNNGGTDQWMVENWDDDYVYIDVPYGHNMHMPWKFTEVTGKPGIYYITIVGGTDNGRNLELDSRDKGSKANPVTRSTSSSTNAGAPGFDEWMLVTPEEYNLATALREDFTSKVATAWNSWTGASGPVGSVTTMTGTTTPLAELYNSSSAGVKMQQSVTGLDNGYYEVRVFASSHNARGEAGASLNGITRDLANVFATSGESTVTKQIVARGVNDGFVGDEQTYPYTMHDVMVKDGTMTIGLNLATAGQTGWHTIQIYSLVKTGDLPLDDKIAAYEAARDAAQVKLSDTGVAPGYLASIQSTLDTYASVSYTDAAALDEATAALNAVNTKAEESRAPYARYNYLKGLTLAIDDDTSAFTPTTNAIDVSAADAAVAAAKTVADIYAAIPLLRQAAKDFANAVTVTPGKTLDLSVLIANFDLEEEDLGVWGDVGAGTWRRMAFTGGFGAEFYHGTRDISQSFTGLPAGSYTASVQVTWRDAQTTGLYLTTAAGTQQTQVNQAYNKGSVEGELVAMSDDPAYARITVSNGVTDGTLTFGLKEKAFGDGNCWTLFDNFRLLYAGQDYSAQEAALAEAVQAAKVAATSLNIPTGMKTALNDTETTYTAAGIEAEGTYEQVIQKFNDAISDINSLIAKANTFVAPYNRYQEVKGYVEALDDDATIYTGDATLDISTAEATAEGATEVANFETAIAQLREAAFAFVTSVTVNEGKYFDLTHAIVENPTVRQNINYWTIANSEGPDWASNGVVNYEETEFYQHTFNFYQTLSLPKGTFMFGVTGFHRAGNHSTYFYAGSNHIIIPGVESSVVDNMAQAKEYFDNGNGRVELKFALDAPQEINIGIENNDTETDKWTIFRDFTLYYYGEEVDLTPYADALAAAVAAANAVTEIPTDAKTALNTVVTDQNQVYTTIADYQSAIAAIETATANAKTLEAPYAAFNTLAQAMLDIAEQDVYTGAKDEFNALSAAADDVETVTTVDGFATKETALRSAFAAFLAAADIDNGKYFDLTGLIVNAGLDQGKTGWNGTTPNDFRESCAEFFNMDFDFYQTLPNMPAGNYELHVQAFQRPGSNNVADPAFAAGNNAVNAFIYVNKGQTTILNVMAQTSPTGYFLEGEGVGPKDYKRVTGDLGYVPNGMTGAHRYFEAGFYENTVLTGIEEGDLKFGFKCDGHPTDAWTIFDNFRLYYYGNSIAVTLDEDVAFSTVSDIEHADVTLHRTFNDGAWNTLVLPFDMAPQQIDEVFGDNVQVAEYVGTEAKEAENMYNLVFSKKTTDGITANVPVMIYGVTKAQDDLYTIEDVTIKVPTSLTKADPEGHIDFVGNYTPGMALQINDFFIASDNNFYKKTEEYNTSVTLKALRGVFRPIDQPDAVKGIGFVVVEDEATGLNEIQSTKDKVPSTVYDLQGRRVATPAKGLYIMDGKKVMLK